MADRYWVGNGGNWTDYTNHWSNTSGGSPGASKPTKNDNIFFDSNSFSSTGQTVTLDGNGTCSNMDWTNANNTPTFNMSNKNMKIYGNTTLISNMNLDITYNPYNFQWNFTGNLGGTHYHNFSNHTLKGEIKFYSDTRGTVESHVLNSNLTAESPYIDIENSNFDANDFDLTLTPLSDAANEITDLWFDVVDSSYTITGELKMGNGTWTLTGAESRFYLRSLWKGTIDFQSENSTLIMNIDKGVVSETYVSIEVVGNFVADVEFNDVYINAISIHGWTTDPVIYNGYWDYFTIVNNIYSKGAYIKFNNLIFANMGGIAVEFEDSSSVSYSPTNFSVNNITLNGNGAADADKIYLMGAENGGTLVKNGDYAIINYAFIEYSTVSGATWYACNCTDIGNNTGWTWACPTAVEDNIVPIYRMGILDQKSKLQKIESSISKSKDTNDSKVKNNKIENDIPKPSIIDNNKLKNKGAYIC